MNTASTTHMPSSKSYGFRCGLKAKDFAQAVTLVTEVLKVEGFGVLTAIDVQATMKAKLSIDGHPLSNPRRLQSVAGPSVADGLARHRPAAAVQRRRARGQ